MIRETLAVLVRGALKVFLLLAVAEAMLLAVVEAFETVRRKRWKQPPKEGFPWEEQPEVELESSDDQIKLYPDYGRLYEDMLAEIDKAEDHIFVETFMWLDDEVGRRFVNALARKAREGVNVCAIFDELANLSQPSSFKDFPDEIHTLRFRSFSGPADTLNPRSLHRTHRKILAVDGRVAFAGGFNIGELFTRWRGTHFRVQGQTVHEIERTFIGFWNTHRSEELPEIPLPKKRAWNPVTIFHSNDPYHHTFPIRDIYLRNIDKAQERVRITSAYFTPGVTFREKMMAAARRGGGRAGALPQVLEPRVRGLAFPAPHRHDARSRGAGLCLRSIHGSCKDRHCGRRVVHGRVLQRGHSKPLRAPRDEPGDLQPTDRREAGVYVRAGQDKRRRAYAGELGEPSITGKADRGCYHPAAAARLS